jgi:hypothetical protein
MACPRMRVDSSIEGRCTQTSLEVASTMTGATARETSEGTLPPETTSLFLESTGAGELQDLSLLAAILE